MIILNPSMIITDTLGRYGGEEFILILPETDVNQAFSISEKIRIIIEGLKIDIDNNESLTCTISAGIAGYPGDSQDIYSVIECADIALYQAKNNGRNQSVIFEN